MEKVNLKDLSRWLLVMPGTGIEFDRPDNRTVRIELNAEQESTISLVREDGEVQFLTNVKGFQLLEFAEGGRFEIISSAPVWMYSSEFEYTSFTVPDPVIFTKIAERRQRSPEVEYMMEVMHRNQEKLYAKLDEERRRSEARIAAISADAERARAAAVGFDPALSGSADGERLSEGDLGEAEGGEVGG